jgi:hypothetical protein
VRAGGAGTGTNAARHAARSLIRLAGLVLAGALIMAATFAVAGWAFWQFVLWLLRNTV